MQLRSSATLSLSVSGARRRKNLMSARCRRERTRAEPGLGLCLSRQSRRLWARPFSRTLAAEHMRCDGRIAYQANCGDPGPAGSVDSGLPVTAVETEPEMAGRLQVKPLPGQAEDTVEAG